MVFTQSLYCAIKSPDHFLCKSVSIHFAAILSQKDTHTYMLKPRSHFTSTSNIVAWRRREWVEWNNVVVDTHAMHIVNKVQGHFP